MKLSASLILGKLKEKYEIKTGKNPSKQACLDRPRLHSSEDSLLENEIYILMNTTLQTQTANFPRTSLLIFAGEKTDNVPLYRDNICLISSPATYQEIFNTIQEIFDVFETWYETVTQSRLHENTIQQMLELSYPLFGNPMVVIGMDFSIIASVKAESTNFNGPVLGSTEETFALITALKQDRLYNEVREQDGWFYYPGISTSSASLCVNIKKFGSTTHRLMLLEELQPLDDSYGFLMEVLASMIEHAFLHNAVHRTAPNKSLHLVFQNLLSDRTADYVSVSQKLDSLGWYSRHEYLCIVFEVSYLDQKNLTINSICSYIENSILHSCALQYKDNVVAYVNMTKSHMHSRDVSEKIIYFIRDSFLKAGYSRVMIGHLNLRRQYIQAGLALEVGSRKHPDLWLHRFNEISFFYILEQATRRLPGYMISHEKLLRLKDMDTAHHTEYMKTLKLYLDNHLNAVQTAKDLYIHRSTFLYRLEKIKSVLRTNFDDPEEVLYLMLSFRFIEMEEETEGYF